MTDYYDCKLHTLSSGWDANDTADVVALFSVSVLQSFTVFATTINSCPCLALCLQQSHCVSNQMVPSCAMDNQANHTFQLLSTHGVSPCSTTLQECQTKQMPRS